MYSPRALHPTSQLRRDAVVEKTIRSMVSRDVFGFYDQQGNVSRKILTRHGLRFFPLRGFRCPAFTFLSCNFKKVSLCLMSVTGNSCSLDHACRLQWIPSKTSPNSFLIHSSLSSLSWSPIWRSIVEILHVSKWWRPRTLILRVMLKSGWRIT